MQRFLSPMLALVALACVATLLFGAFGGVLTLCLLGGVVLAASPRVRKVAGYRLACLAYDLRAMLGAALAAFVFRFGLALRVFPGAVKSDLGLGIVGELAFNGPFRAQPARIAAAAVAANCAVGRWFTLAADGTASPGGAGSIGGILMNPKNYVSTGAGGVPLAPSMLVVPNSIGEFGYFGAFVVAAAGAVALGQAAWYDTTTGAIGAGAPGAGQAAIPNSKFTRYANAAAGLAVLELTN